MKQHNLLYICFNRSDLVKLTFPELVNLGWDNIVIACDGGRTNEEQIEVNKVRREIEVMLEVFSGKVCLIYREYNFGCRRNIEHALEFFFRNYERGWVFEDDIKLKDPRVFKDLRNKWDGKGHLSLYNPIKINTTDIFRTNIGHYFIWGWFLDSNELPSFRSKVEFNSVIRIIKTRGLVKGFRFLFLYVRTLMNNIDTWDSIYTAWAISNRIDLNIVPSSFVENLGFDERATHTFEEPKSHQTSVLGAANVKVWEKTLKRWL
jgi:hypothetical protein